MNLQVISFYTKTALGTIAVSASDKGLRSLALPTRKFRGPRPAPPPREFSELIDQLKAYCAGSRVSFSNYDLDLSDATLFQTKVWQVTRSIPYGETRSYRWVAEQIGQPAASRAVGQALGKNPLPVIIPCHRVVASDGGVGGYSGGLETKRRLLEMEKATH